MRVSKKHRRYILPTVSLISLVCILCISGFLYLKVTSILKDPLVIGANVTDISGEIVHNTSFNATFSVSIDNSFLCTASCSERLFDINSGTYIHNASFTPSSRMQKRRSFLLNAPAYGKGNMAYRYELHCSNQPSAWCPGSGKERIQSVFMSVSYRLTDTKKEMLETMKAAYPQLVTLHTDVMNRSHRLNTTIAEFERIFNKTALSGERSTLKYIREATNGIQKKEDLLLAHIREERIGKAYRLFQDMNTTMRSLYATTEDAYKRMERKQSAYGRMRSVFDTVFNETDAQMRSFFTELAQHRRTAETLAYEKRIEEMIESYKEEANSVSFLNLNGTVDKLLQLKQDMRDLRNNYTTKRKRVQRNLCMDMKRSRIRAQNIFNATIYGKVRDTPCNSTSAMCSNLTDALDSIHARPLNHTHPNISCTTDENTSVCFFTSPSVNRSLNYSAYQEILHSYETAVLRDQPYPGNASRLVSAGHSYFPLNTSLIKSINASQQLACKIATRNETLPQSPSYPVFEPSQENASFNTSSRKALPDIEKKCCFYGSCAPCKNKSSWKGGTPPPILFIHGHLFNKESLPDFSIMAFERIMKELEPDGYIHAGEFDMRSSTRTRRIGPYRHPLQFTASYYYITYFDIGVDKIEFRRRDHIENYALRLNEIIKKVKRKTGSQDVVLVAYSMGGLVARSYIDIFDESDLAMLITVATPHKGISGIARQVCHLTGSSVECGEMAEGSLFLERLSEDRIGVPFHNIAAKGCLMKGGSGDGIVTFENAQHPDAVQHTVRANCSGSVMGGMHQDIINPNIPPYIVPALRDILGDFYYNSTSAG